MKLFRCILAIISIFVFLTSYCPAEDWTTTDGKTYKNIRVLEHDDTTVTILDEEGGATVPLAHLPPDLQKKYGYNPAKAYTLSLAASHADFEEK